ncbi:sensor histidine kinase [Streptomyces sp. TRM43335]|uniref:Sensor histidine kinase n=2 Tax=Streptomyces taklimakanensis TaxID=2569853 RepID=A0A6G2BC02_9ACTN|nr:histidine kinase [Streptomyces taklimakanensis]MTE19811.1 sensor histidine kinase [Streptomyces taklimakanensis]
MRRSSGPVRFHQYTRGTLYCFAVSEAVLLGFWCVAGSGGDDIRLVLPLIALFVAVCVCHLLLIRDGLRYYLGAAERPTGLAVAYVVLVVGGIAVLHTGVGTGLLNPGAVVASTWLLMFFPGPLLLVLPVRRCVALGAGVLACSTLSVVAAGVRGEQLGYHMSAAVFGMAVFGFSYRCSGWTMRVVNELEEARETQARLAVAEERLRFGRDMHDVLGRNLSVIALKSELAVQLAQRGSPLAVEQMTEVQRIARESQREMREVVRGYRETDLHTELVGARGVLRAAGIDCRIEDDGSDELTGPLHAALGWVVREGTTNVLRHADARLCTVRLWVTGPGDGGAGGAGPVAELVMENDGAPRSGTAAGGGSGLAGLRERLAVLGGTLTGERGSDGTFRLAARVPLRPADDGGTGRTGRTGRTGGDAGGHEEGTTER